MKVILIALALTVAFGAIQHAAAQEIGGGVDKDGTWYVGEGLKAGDVFSYSVCHVDYKECKEFQMDFWIKGDIKSGSENKWLVETVVYDGRKIVKGDMHLGKVAPEPTGGSADLLPYRSAFKSSIVWLSSFATSYGGEGGEGPKAFRDISWGKIGNIGGQQVKPTTVENVNTREGLIEDAVLVTWRTGGVTSQIWVVDEFPFPVKASTWTHVSEGIAPQEYNFELLDYTENVTEDPYAGVVSTTEEKRGLNCPTDYDYVKVKKTTSLSSYLLDVKYGPPEIKIGCDIEWILNFRSPYDDTEFLNQVQYDIIVEKPSQDGAGPQAVQSLAQDEGRLFLYSPSGQVRTFMKVDTSYNPTNYALLIYGLAPKDEKPSGFLEYLRIQVPFDGPTTAPAPAAMSVPDWIKSSASFWVEGHTSEGEFVSAMQFLVKEGVIVLPPTDQGTGSGTEVPDWIKSTTKFWIDGHTSDGDFLSAIQYLVKEGIITL